MGLRNQPRVTVTVQNRKYTPGSAGQRELVNDGAPVTVRCTVHPLDETEIQLYGDSAQETRKVFSYPAGSWPGGLNAVITYDGGDWDQQWPKETHGIGQSTKHDEAVIRRRTGFKV